MNGVEDVGRGGENHCEGEAELWEARDEKVRPARDVQVQRVQGQI